jgi:hypothetical protein
MTPTKANKHTTKDLMDNEEDEIPISELKRMVRMISEMKDMHEIKDNVNKNLNEFNGNVKKQINNSKRIQRAG